ncbi:MAG: MFS transporter [Cyanophyceae cyanobacterium]
MSASTLPPAPLGSRLHIWLLFGCQALGMTSNSILFTVAALIGVALAPDPAWATLPLALLHLVTMITTIPASMLMRRVGRRLGFQLGVLIGITGTALGTTAVLTGSFGLFAVAMAFMGSFNAFLGFYRFAAIEVAPPDFGARAVSLVIAGGVLAALFGAPMARGFKDWIPEAEFAGCLVVMGLLLLPSLAILSQISFPVPRQNSSKREGRPLGEIIRQPLFAVAALGSTVGYGMMVLVMTATPLAMRMVPFTFGQTALVIQWHVLGMFAPSFFTGSLIRRLGVTTVIAMGCGLTLVSCGINLLGEGLGHYWFALLMLGLGWNFMFIGSTTLLTQSCTAEEAPKVQAAHDFLMFGSVTLAALLSGGLLNRFGWSLVNGVSMPLVGVVLIALVWLHYQQVKPIHS